jgi:uncharacterized protein (TIGR00251 family)
LEGGNLRLTEDEGSVTFQVRVIPRARRSEVAGILDGALKVRLAAPPLEGAANEALVKFLAERLGVRARDVEILSGHTSRMKTIRVSGPPAEEVRRLSL